MANKIAKLMSIGVLGGGGGVKYETPDYGNWVPAGYTITATPGLMNDDPAVSALINGTQDDECWFTSGLNAAGKEITIDIGHLVVCSEVKWQQDIIATQGTWVVKASVDNATKVSVSSNVSLGGSATQTIATPGWESTPYRYLHLTGVSGTTSSAAYTRELSGKIGNPI